MSASFPVRPDPTPDPRASERVPGKALSRGDRNQNPAGISFPALIAEDFETHGRKLMSPGFWSLAVYRFGNWRMSVKSRALRPPLTLAYRVAHQAVMALWAIDLPYNSRVGRRLHIQHHGGFFLGAWSVGDDVTIRGCATIGLIRKGTDRSPIIGSNVEIGPGACIVGDISVGDGAFIGPNTVVTQNVPAGATVLGNPSRIVDLARVTGETPAKPSPETPSVERPSPETPNAEKPKA